MTVGERSLTAAQLLRHSPAALPTGSGITRPCCISAPTISRYPVALFGAALAGVPFVPLNYRLGEQQLTALQGSPSGALVSSRHATSTPHRSDALDGRARRKRLPRSGTVTAVAVIIYTSGTTPIPRPAVLRHRHLLAYVLNTMEFASAAGTDAAVGVRAAVPHRGSDEPAVEPLHRAPGGLSGRVRPDGVARHRPARGRHARDGRADDAGPHRRRTADERRGHADAAEPGLRRRPYSAARSWSARCASFPDTGFVNAYGLTETASSIAVLGPEDHRVAFASSDPAVRDRLGSVGRPLPGIEIEIRDRRRGAVDARRDRTGVRARRADLR